MTCSNERGTHSIQKNKEHRKTIHIDMTTTRPSISRLSERRQQKPAAGSMEKTTDSQRPFARINFILMAVCLAMIIIGFILMSGPGSSVEGGFNPDIFSTRRIVVGPTVSFLGFLLMAFAIIYTPKSRRTRRND